MSTYFLRLLYFSHNVFEIGYNNPRCWLSSRFRAYFGQAQDLPPTKVNHPKLTPISQKVLDSVRFC